MERPRDINPQYDPDRTDRRLRRLTTGLYVSLLIGMSAVLGYFYYKNYPVGQRDPQPQAAPAGPKGLPARLGR